MPSLTDVETQLSTRDDAVTLSLSSQVHLGRFARFAHAVPLLSQALSRSEEAPSATAQLRRTLLSLTNLGDMEGEMRAALFCTLHAACYT